MNKIPNRKRERTSRNKGEELMTVADFWKILRLCPDIKESERPDFICSFRNGELIVGLELTYLFTDAQRSGGSKEKERSAKWEKFAETLREQLRTQCGPIPRLHGSVFFKRPSASVLPRLDLDQLAKEIIIILLGMNKYVGDMNDFNSESTPLLEKHVDHLYVWIRKPYEPERLWRCSDFQTGTGADPVKAIKSAVKKKQTKASKFDWQNSQERWLLICAPGHGLADLAPYFDDPGIADPEPFTGIFVWDRWTEKIFCISRLFAEVVDEERKLHLGHLCEAIRQYVRR